MNPEADHTGVRCLRLVLGDQLSRDNPVLRELDSDQDLIWLCEAAHEATQVPSHKAASCFSCRRAPLRRVVEARFPQAPGRCGSVRLAFHRGRSHGWPGYNLTSRRTD